MTEISNEEDVLALAVREAGASIRAHFENGAQVYTKADKSPVTDADLAANAIILQHLRAAFPEDAILSEETAPDTDLTAAERCWIIDPLDGTASFVRRERHFAVMVGLEVGGRPHVGAIYYPMYDELYTATAGRGVRLTKEGATTTMRFTPPATPEAGRIGTTPGSLRTLTTGSPHWTGDPALLLTTDRGFGFRPKALMNGRFDAFIGWLADGLNSGGYPWDLCATDLITYEAGGVLTDIYGHPYEYRRVHERLRGGIVAATDAALHQRVLSMIAE